MLKQLKKLFAIHIQAATQSLVFLWQRPLATSLTVLVLAITLALPSLCWVLTTHLGQLSKDWQTSEVISLYLKSNTTVVNQQQLVDELRNMSAVNQVILKSPEESMQELQQQEGMNDIMRYLPQNPLPAVIEITPNSSSSSPADVKLLLQRLKSFPEVDQAKLDMEWLKRLHAILQFTNAITKGVMFLLGLAVILIVGNTLRLAIHNRQDEIRVLKLIGAGDPFIVRPFLYASLWYGLFGAILALLFVNLFMLNIAVSFGSIAQAYELTYTLGGLTLFQSYVIIFTAIFLSWLGAKLVVKRQLIFIEPYN